MPSPCKRTLAESPSRQVDGALTITDLFAEKGAGFDMVVGTLEGFHGTFVNDQSDKAYFILSGAGEVFLDDQTISVAAHDFVYIPPGVRHGIKGKLTFLILCSPPLDCAHEKRLDRPS